MSNSLNVVVIDDSPFVCRLLTSYLHDAVGMQVVGTAHQGQRGLELVRLLRPDAVTLDIDMPGLSGLDVLDRIMQDCPTPVVLLSGVSGKAAAATVTGLAKGAVDFVLKYTPGIDTNPDTLRREVVDKVRMASRIKVIRSLGEASKGTGALQRTARASRATVEDRAPWVVAIGASTGGPVALRDLLIRLPPSFPAAVVVVQHMPPLFTEVLARQLHGQLALPVREAEDGDRLEAGLILIVPGDCNMTVSRMGQVHLRPAEASSGPSPSIDLTMTSLAEAYGRRSVGVVLTGMGDDGSLGLEAIHQRGGRTYAQDGASCVVNGMPQAAVNRGVVHLIAKPADIGRMLVLDAARMKESS